ncbi:MAG: cytochrome c553 [Gammaproteobacteria bacterium]|jgi:cytochrome c553
MNFSGVQHALIAAAGCAAVVLFSASATAAGNAERGKAKSVTCQACHGPTGNSENAAFPKLAGQYRDYLVHALTRYNTIGGRTNAIMQGMAASLSKQDIEDLAAWYASQKGLKTLEGQR